MTGRTFGLYDMVVLAIPVALLVRLGLAHGFRSYELPALGAVAVLLFLFPLFEAPTGFIATLIVSAMILRRCGLASSRAASALSHLGLPQLRA